MRRGHTEKAHGPYKRGRKFRVVETSATGARSTIAFDSEAEALAYIAEYNDDAKDRSVAGAVDDYLEHLERQGLKAGSVKTLSYRLKAITRFATRDRLLCSVTPAAAAELYAERVAKVKADTHRGELAAVSSLFGWCVEQGWLRANPFALVRPEGRKARRKDHLRIDEARAFLAAALSDATDAGLACAMALLMGLRASEVCSLRVRDVDDYATVLWISNAKTDAGDRKLEVAPDVRTRLSRRIEDREPDELLFGDVDRQWLYYHVQRIADLAKVGRKVSPHSLRRTWSAIGAESMPIDAVSRALGHADTTTTRRHYQPTNAEERRASAAVLRSIAGGKR